MKLLDKIWNMLGLVESEDADEAQTTPTDKSTVRPEKKNERVNKTVEESKPRRNFQPEPAPPVSGPPQAAKPAQGLPVSPESGGCKGKLSIVQPLGFDDARQIAENVTNGKTVIVNFEKTDGETTKRTVDFMSGITFAVGGTVQRISSTVFLFAPSQVEVFSSERFADDEQSVLPWRRS